MSALLFLSLSAVLTGCTSTPQTPREPLVFANQPQTVESQLAVVRAAADKYRDFSVAEREGWKVFGDDAPLMGYHYSGPAPDYVSGDQLDFSQPNNLMYTDINGKKVLTGVAFVVRIGDGEPLPEGFAGNQDHWHVTILFAQSMPLPRSALLLAGWPIAGSTRITDPKAIIAAAWRWSTLG